MVDHTNFLKNLREEMPVQIPSKYIGQHGSSEVEGEDQGQVIHATENGGEDQDAEYADTNTEFYDSDYDVEDGDDDLFLANTDKDVNDNNEQTEMIEQEDDAGLDHDYLNLTKEQHMELKYKSKEFNLEVDMETPVLKIGMVFPSMPEFRKALNAYSVNERVKVRKPTNEATRLDVICEIGCTWMIKVSHDSKTEATVVRKYNGLHKCEKQWEVQTLTTPFLTQCFIDEFRDNQKIDLHAFAAKVERKFNMCPNRFKLGRARKAVISHKYRGSQYSSRVV